MLSMIYDLRSGDPMFLPDMLCLVQGFQQQGKEKKNRRLSFMRRKKISSECERYDDKLLHPNVPRDSTTLCQQEKKGIKLLSGSAPSMTCASLDPSPSLTPTTCRSRQKKFQRHFKVDPDEQVIDYYSCALVADILLQGYLYISKNYFAFYSNVFGYVTKLQIPTRSVINVTREKTAYVFPNAVAVVTADDRHVFSSLISREATYKLMVQVWHSVHSASAFQSIMAPEVDAEPELSLREDSSSPSGSESMYEDKMSANKTNIDVHVPTLEQVKESPPQIDTSPPGRSLLSLPRSTLLLTVATTLLVALFLSAGVLIYRVSVLQYSLSVHDPQGSRTLCEVQEFLDTNLDKLYKVRQSLEVLSLMMESEKEKLVKGVEDPHQGSLLHSETEDWSGR